MEKEMIQNRIKRKVIIFIFITAACFAMTGVVMTLWNWLMPDIFSVKPISYFQALGLFILSRILFGSFRFGGQGRPGFGRPNWKQKWMDMSEEDRLNLKERWKQKCGLK